MIEWWIDIPNLQTVILPSSFYYIESKSITRICMNMNEWIDVSPILADLVQIQSQNYISNTIQTVNRQMSLQATNAVDSRLMNHKSMNNRIRRYHMNRKYHNRQMKHGYRDNSFLNSKLHKNEVISKMYDRHTIEQFHKLRINK